MKSKSYVSDIMLSDTYFHGKFYLKNNKAKRLNERGEEWSFFIRVAKYVIFTRDFVYTCLVCLISQKNFIFSATCRQLIPCLMRGVRTNSERQSYHHVIIIIVYVRHKTNFYNGVTFFYIKFLSLIRLMLKP